MKFPYKGIFAFCSAVCLFAVSMPISTVAASAETSPRKAVQADCVSDFADADSEDGYAKVIMFENKIKSLFSEDEIKVFFNVLDKLYDYTEE